MFCCQNGEKLVLLTQEQMCVELPYLWLDCRNSQEVPCRREAWGKEERRIMTFMQNLMWEVLNEFHGAAN